jgi:aryl-alcohol dehydrogenase-like predicted oxidoreductase
MKYVEGIRGDKRISRIGLGTWQFGSKEWGYGEDYQISVADRIVARAAEVGITLFDTAEIYAFGRSERILGTALERAGVLDGAFIASKIFPMLPVGPIVGQRARGSASRIGVPCLDLYQVHQPNPLVPDSLIMPRMRDLQDEGTVVEVGVSNYSLERWKKAEKALGRPVLSNQVQFSLAHAQPLAHQVPYAQEQGRLVIAYSPLGQGLLSAKYDATNPPSGAIRQMNPLFLEENLNRAAGLLDTLREVAAAHHATPAQIALAWLIHHPGVVVIPGASSVQQVEANAAAAEIDLTDDEAAELSAQARAFRPQPRAASALDQVQGQAAALMAKVRDRLPFI